MSTLTTTAMHWAEKGWVPDLVVRSGIRPLLRERLSELPLDRPTEVDKVKKAFVSHYLFERPVQRRKGRQS